MNDAEELPRLHAIKAACCGKRIMRFDLPSRTPQMLAEGAVRRSWTLDRDGNWTCDQHLETPR